MRTATKPRWNWLPLALLLLSFVGASAQGSPARSYIGFDRNDYPGDANLPLLRKSFRFSSYWLNNPPGARHNTWIGKRALLAKHGFGFLVLFNGRLYNELRGKDATALGEQDGEAAADAARREGFQRNTLIFIDQEEGGRLLPEQAAYLFAWADAVRAAGYRAGVYCSGIDLHNGNETISTARDIVAKENARIAQGTTEKSSPRLKLWIANDQCPPAPGCSLRHPELSAAVPKELTSSVLVWQYAQSPRRPQFTSGCPANYAADNRCYAPGLPQGADTFVDLNVSNTPNPSAAH
jgi:hypothetical protein